MNPKVLAGVIGVVTLVLGLIGLFYPEQTMHLVGYGYTNPENRPGTLGEVRAVYGGLMVVLGAFTLLAAPDPSRHQGWLLLIGLLWIGTASGRVVGLFFDGNPGIVGWLSVVTELIAGGALLLASQARDPSVDDVVAPTPVA
jgi:uncharacterized protein DUF4345